MSETCNSDLRDFVRSTLMEIIGLIPNEEHRLWMRMRYGMDDNWQSMTFTEVAQGTRVSYARIIQLHSALVRDPLLTRLRRDNRWRREYERKVIEIVSGKD